MASLTSLAIGFTAPRTFFARVFDVVTGTIFVTLKWNGGTGGVVDPLMIWFRGPLPPSTASRIAPPTSTTAIAPPTIARRRTTFDRWVVFLARPGVSGAASLSGV